MAAAAVFVVYLALACWAARAEYIWSNEAWFTSAAFTLVHQGRLGTTLLASQGTWMAGLDRHTYWIPPLYLLIESFWGRLFGFSVIAVRALSTLAGAFVLLGWYRIVLRLTGSGRQRCSAWRSRPRTCAL